MTFPWYEDSGSDRKTIRATWARFESCHLRLIDPRRHPHLLQRDQGEHRAAGDNDIARVAVPPRDQTIERGNDDSILETGLVELKRLLSGHQLLLAFGQSRLRLVHCCSRRTQTLDRPIAVLFRENPLSAQTLRARVAERGEVERSSGVGLVGDQAIDRSLACGDVRFLDLHLVPEVRIVESDQDLAGSDPVTLIHQDLADPARDLRADRDLRPRLDSPRSHHFLDELPSPYL